MIISWVIGSAVLLMLSASYYYFVTRQKSELEQSIDDNFEKYKAVDQTFTESVPGLLEEEPWWHQIDAASQLALAVQLTKKSLPIWERYAAGKDMVYRNAGSGPFIKLDQQLLVNVLQDIQQLYHCEDVNKRKLLHQYYDSFVGPVIAMHDGDWPAPYPVKKLFLAVYNIIKSALEKNNQGTSKSLLAVAINQSLDCLDISGIHSKQDILEFLTAYKNNFK